MGSYKKPLVLGFLLAVLTAGCQKDAKGVSHPIGPGYVPIVGMDPNYTTTSGDNPGGPAIDGMATLTKAPPVASAVRAGSPMIAAGALYQVGDWDAGKESTVTANGADNGVAVGAIPAEKATLSYQLIGQAGNYYQISYHLQWPREDHFKAGKYVAVIAFHENGKVSRWGISVDAPGSP